jgi:hypothetical protein
VDAGGVTGVAGAVDAGGATVVAGAVGAALRTCPGALAELPGLVAGVAAAELLCPGALAEFPGRVAGVAVPDLLRPGARAEFPGLVAECPGALAELPGERLIATRDVAPARTRCAGVTVDVDLEPPACGVARLGVRETRAAAAERGTTVAEVDPATFAVGRFRTACAFDLTRPNGAARAGVTAGATVCSRSPRPVV